MSGVARMGAAEALPSVPGVGARQMMGSRGAVIAIVAICAPLRHYAAALP